MKATGIVRRIDDLGRVVIPKEIRRTMRIREGDPLEIYTNAGGEVIFKKYSPVEELSNFAVSYAESMAKETKLCVIICDRDHCVASAGIPKREVLDRRVSPALEDVMDNRREKAYTAADNAVALEGLDRPLLIAVPIIAAGDISGVVALTASDNSDVLSEADTKLCAVAAAFLGKQMED